jgi:hypothetical protein
MIAASSQEAAYMAAAVPTTTALVVPAGMTTTVKTALAMSPHTPHAAAFSARVSGREALDAHGPAVMPAVTAARSA